MRVEIDQSGKIGDTSVDTVLAYSNAESYTVLIPRQVKRECLLLLRRQGIPANTIYYRLFSISLYFLLRERIDRIDQAIIDVEYPKHEESLRRYLLNLLRRGGKTIGKEKVQFAFIGKKSNAHRLGLETFQGKREANLVLTVEDVLAEFRK